MHPPKRITSVGIVEDDPAAIQWFQTLLAGDESFSFHGAATNERDAIAQFGTNPPDILLIDIDLGAKGGNGLNVVEALATRGVGCALVITSVLGDEHNVFGAFLKGAESYLKKPLTARTLFDALNRIRAGDPFFSPSIARMMLNHFKANGSIPNAQRSPAQAAAQEAPESQENHGRPDATPDALDKLSPRQWQILQGLAEAKLFKEIAEGLKISESTVKVHAQKLYLKLKVRTNTEAIKAYHKSKSARKKEMPH